MAIAFNYTVKCRIASILELGAISAFQNLKYEKKYSSFKSISYFNSLSLFFTIVVNAQDSTTLILENLQKRLTPVEWEYLKDQTQSKSILEQSKDVIPWLTTLLALIALILQQKWQLARDRQSHLYNSLHWFEGDTQKRSLGIAVIEANWNSAKSLHRTWTAVLTNQALYLLGQSGQKDATHEIANLKRIMNLLLLHKGNSSVLEYKLLTKEISKKIERG